MVSLLLMGLLSHSDWLVPFSSMGVRMVRCESVTLLWYCGVI